MTRADTPGILGRIRPYWWLLAIVVLVLGSAPFARSPLHDAATLEPVVEASLRLPTSYVLLAPVSDTFDMLTLLSVRQHVALLLTLALIFLACWWTSGRQVPEGLTRGRRAVRHTVRIGLPLLGLFAFYSAGVLLPRPMAALDVGPNLVAVDFHTHTKYSHDARPDWTPEDARAWHRDAGYAVAYVTDHRSYEGARDAWANNPANAGENTTMLPGIEVVWKGEHVNVLDAERVYRGIVTESLRDIDEDALRMASTIPFREPMLVQTLPGNLDHMIPAKGNGTAGVRAIELVDGAPRGLGQTRRERARILALADSFDLALVAGSDNHGWGRTASAWTLFSLPGWRASNPQQLADAIELVLRRGGRHSTRVVARYVPDTEAGIALPFTAPLVTWAMFRTLSPEERVAWLVWAFVLAGLMHLRAKRRA